MSEVITVHYKPPYFIERTTMNGGCLPFGDMAAMGIWYYFLLAAHLYATRMSKGAILYEHDKHGEADFKKLFMTIAELYSVNPQEMARRWELVEKECNRIGWDLNEMLPNKSEYRQHAATIIIN